MLYGEIVEHPSFQTFRDILHLGFSASWREDHQKVPFWSLWKELKQTVDPDIAEEMVNKTLVMEKFVDIITTMQRFDQRISWSADDMDWLVGVLDSGKKKVVFNLLLAYASASKEHESEVLY